MIEKNLRVLVLEDQPSDAELVLYELKRSGYQADATRVDNRADYLEALAIKPDLILSDYSMPQFTALEALHLLQDRGLDIPFIVVTGSFEEAAIECMKQGASDYLLKDRLGRLGQAIERSLEQKRLRDEKRAADQALRASEERFRSLVQNLKDIITVHAADGVIRYITPSAYGSLGYLPESLLGQDLSVYIHPDDLMTVQAIFEGVQVGPGGTSTVEYRFRHASGEWIYLESVCTNLLANPAVGGVILTSRDITERKRYEQQLRKTLHELAEAYDATIEGWARALDLRDKETEEHTRRVTALTIDLARHVGIPESELVHIWRGAILHDIGKIGVSDTILLKPGPLTDAEWVEMRKHPEYARSLIEAIPFLRPAVTIPYAHHERWDGSGYPRQLKGEEIPLPARIFSIVDVWDALCSDRPYRKACPEHEVLDYIKSQSGKCFDPALVQAFLKVVQRNGYR